MKFPCAAPLLPERADLGFLALLSRADNRDKENSRTEALAGALWTRNVTETCVSISSGQSRI